MSKGYPQIGEPGEYEINELAPTPEAPASNLFDEIKFAPPPEVKEVTPIKKNTEKALKWILDLEIEFLYSLIHFAMALVPKDSSIASWLRKLEFCIFRFPKKAGDEGTKPQMVSESEDLSTFSVITDPDGDGLVSEVSKMQATIDSLATEIAEIKVENAKLRETVEKFINSQIVF